MDGDLIVILLLTALGAAAAVDTAAFGQFMAGQPLVAGWVAGIIVGQPLAGLLMGAALQMLWSRLAPVGAAAYPDVGPATVGGVGTLGFWAAARAVPPRDPGAGFGAHGVPVGFQIDTNPMAILLGLGLALGAGWAGQQLVIRMRRGNADLGRMADAAAAIGDFGGIERANLLGLVRAAALGAIVTGLTLLAGLPAVVLLQRLALPGAGPNPGVHLFWWIAIAAIATSLWTGGRRDALWLLAGLAAGALMVGLGVAS